MDKEDKKSSSRRRSTPLESSFDSEDEEPIGSLFKLKAKRNPKKVKVETEGGNKGKRGVKAEILVVQDEDMGGMDDTLASFRKKLKGPKKDVGTGLTTERDVNVVESLGQSSSGTFKDASIDLESRKSVDRSQLSCSDINDFVADNGLQGVAKKRPRRSRASSAKKKSAPDVGNCEILMAKIPGNDILHTEKQAILKSGTDSGHCLVDKLEDSLSALFRKAQSGLTKKSHSTLRSKQGKKSQLHFKLNSTSDAMSEELLPVVVKKSQSALEFVGETLDSDAVNAGEEISSIPVTKEEVFRSSGGTHVNSFRDIMEDLVPSSLLQRSRVPTEGYSERTPGMEDIEALCQTNREPLSGTQTVNCLRKKTSNVCNSTLSPELVDSTRHFDEAVTVGKRTGASGNDSNRNQKVPSSSLKEVRRPNDSVCLNQLLEFAVHDTTEQLSREGLGLVASATQDPLASNEMTFVLKDVDRSDKSPIDSRRIQPRSSSSTSVISNNGVGCGNHCQYQAPDVSNGKNKLAPIFSLPRQDVLVSDGSGFPIPACEIKEKEFSLQTVSHENALEASNDPDHSHQEQALHGSVHIIQKCSSNFHENLPFDGTSKSECISKTEEVNITSGHELGTGCKENKLSAIQRTVRKAKKRRHGDMAYEGDSDWDILIDEQDFLPNHEVGDGEQIERMGKRLNSLSVLVSETENEGAAVVSAGLKVHAAVPVEKIIFKEILKRRGGLQEYLECRNHILRLWNKDVTRILPLSDCGVCDWPSIGESPRASLMRNIYAFLDHRGYINIGVASEKNKTEINAIHNFKLLKEKNFCAKSGTSVADSEDGVSFIVGKVKNFVNSRDENNDLTTDDANPTPSSDTDKKPIDLQDLEIPMSMRAEGCTANTFQENGCLDVKLCNGTVSLDSLSSIPSIETLDDGKPPSGSLLSYEVEDMGIVPVTYPESQKHVCGGPPQPCNEVCEHMSCDSEVKKKIIVIGAGPAGLSAARHLQRQGFHVTILEGRNRIGGRVFTDRSSLSVPVDLGASIITGVEADVASERRPDPSSLICAQLGLELTVLNSECPLYDIITSEKVPADLDEALEGEYNSLLDDSLLLVAQKGEHALKMSLEDGLEYALKRRCMARSGRIHVQNEMQNSSNVLTNSEDFSGDDKIYDDDCSRVETLAPLERRVMDWHFANLEYGCAALLKEVSLPYWNQDDVYGGFGGAHCMIKGGYSTVVESLADGLCIHLSHTVTEISYSPADCLTNGNQCNKVKVTTSNGREFFGEGVLITVPLGCLKAETIKFSPPLPEWKYSSIQRLGFGVLNKVVLEFPEVFWDENIDYFGTTAEETSQRGHCFMFWNVKKTVGAPVLIALVVGKAAVDGQNISCSDNVDHAVKVLRKLFGEESVPQPIASVVTDWGRDPYSYGAYSYVAVGASGEDYDILGRPVENCLFFAGEATCKEHPDTVGGAMMSGLREAVRIIDILNSGSDYTAEVEAMEVAQRHSDGERSEIRDIIRRLDVVDFSNVVYNNSSDKAQILIMKDLLQDMFTSAKTTTGRLHLVKELLKLPVEVLKSFAGTNEGLTTLNAWILDSLGKDGTQLLRQCVRLLVLVSTDLLAVRLSGIGKTVKEKVCMHTSRDIRAIASQLVSVWIEVFRREKASNGGLKLLRQSNAADSTKNRSFGVSGKPPLRAIQVAPDNKGNSKVSLLCGSHLSNLNKRVNHKSDKSDTGTDLRFEVRQSGSQGSVRGGDPVGLREQDHAITEEEKAAIEAAEAARAAVVAAAKAYESSTAKSNAILPLPKIPSFHKFARRELYAQMESSDIRAKWSNGNLCRQDCISEIDSRNCRVRDWSLDFSVTGVNLDNSKISVDGSQHSHSNENGCQLSFREHSGESVAADSSILTKAWVDCAGSDGIKDYNAIERWQSQAAAAESDFYQGTVHETDEEDSNMSLKLPSIPKLDVLPNESSASQVTINREVGDKQTRGPARIKQAVVDYVASLLMPLYKARKIDKEGYKSIMKKTATKVMEQTTDSEKAMAVFEFLDFKRKNKIRAFVDQLIERHMGMKSSEKS